MFLTLLATKHGDFEFQIYIISQLCFMQTIEGLTELGWL